MRIFRGRTRPALKKGDPVMIRSEQLSGTVYETHKDNVEVRIVAQGVEERRHFTYEVVEKLLTLDEMAKLDR
jgi:hypothetical protein